MFSCTVGGVVVSGLRVMSSCSVREGGVRGVRPERDVFV